MSDDECVRDTGDEIPIANDGGTSLPTRVFRALATQRRRYVLYYLRDHERAETDDLATQLAAWERDVPVAEVSTEEANRVRTSLVHSHLPKLDDYGFVDYDPRSESVCYTYPPGLLDDALELAAALEDHS